MTKVLVADDALAMRELVKDGLAEFGFEFLVAENGQEALEKGSKNDIKLIISDLEMPYMNGDELIRRLLEVRPGIPAILMSGDAQKLFEAKMTLPRTVITLRKPFSIQELRLKVQRQRVPEIRAPSR
ncbi:MAG: response regulator [Candidatus Doudnabacteria bacterium]|nr:response regulator [bacterium]MDZ4243914.1 response regulator [Candidatus Doudnabacteria bacterium]